LAFKDSIDSPIALKIFAVGSPISDQFSVKSGF